MASTLMQGQGIVPGRKQSSPSIGGNYFRRNNGAEATSSFCKGFLAVFPGDKHPPPPPPPPVSISSFPLFVVLSALCFNVPFCFNLISEADCITRVRRESSKWKDERSSLTAVSPHAAELTGPCPMVQNEHGPFFKQQIQLQPLKQDVCR